MKFSDKIFLALLDMTSTSLEEIEGISELETLIMELESVEASLTDKIKEYWTQNKNLEVNFRYDLAKPGDPPPMHEGFILSTRIKNTRHRATVNFDERSMGFIWFFSFLVWFSKVKDNYGDNLFLLLDEPGLSLHGKAQQDLLRYINTELRPEHQVIYSAHSPFMIDVENIFSLRTVEDVVEVRKTDGESEERILGTKVGERILSRDKDTLFPLQGVVGFDIGANPLRGAVCCCRRRADGTGRVRLVLSAAVQALPRGDGFEVGGLPSSRSPKNHELRDLVCGPRSQDSRFRRLS